MEAPVSTPLLFVSWIIVGLVGLLTLRLARSAHRGKSLAEALMAAFFFGGGVLGYGVLLLRPTFDVPYESFAWGRTAADIGFLVPPMAVALFTWRVFRPTNSWAQGFAIGLSLSTVTLHAIGLWLAADLGANALLESRAGLSTSWIGSGLRLLAFGWACLEASAYYRKALKRLGYGIGDPLVANRFLLWAIWSGAAATMLVLRHTSRLLMDPVVGSSDSPVWVVIAQMVAGLTCATAVWLTFAAPQLYRNRILARFES